MLTGTKNTLDAWYSNVIHLGIMVEGRALDLIYNDDRNKDGTAGHASATVRSTEKEWSVTLFLHDRPNKHGGDNWISMGSYDWVYDGADVRNIDAWKEDMAVLMLFHPWELPELRVC
jgi:hypothetical protein